MPKLSEILGEAYNNLSDDIKNKYKDIDLVDSSKHVSLDEFNQVKKEREDYKNSVVARDKQIKDLEPLTKDNEELKIKLTTMQEENQQALSKQETEYRKQMFDIALNSKLLSYNAKNPKVLKSLLDVDKLTLDNDNIIGLNEQIEAIKKSDDYLFEKEIKGSGHFGGTPSATIINEPGGEGNKLSLGERLAKKKAESITAPEQLKDFIRR